MRFIKRYGCWLVFLVCALFLIRTCFRWVGLPRPTQKEQAQALYDQIQIGMRRTKIDALMVATDWQPWGLRWGVPVRHEGKAGETALRWTDFSGGDVGPYFIELDFDQQGNRVCGKTLLRVSANAP
jgi:hypothetical protein